MLESQLFSAIKRVYMPSTLLEGEPPAKFAKVKKEYPNLSSLVRNSHKAINEAHDPSYRINSIHLLPPINSSDSRILNINASHAAICGKRPKMEDFVLYKETKSGLLFGIFDGHGGPDVAELVKDFFEENFESKLEECQGDVGKTITIIGKMIDAQLAEFDADGAIEWNDQGSTVGINYYDKKNNLIYTATLGDSEAVLYRKIEEVWTAIPLSCVRNWESEKDRQRAESAIAGTINAWGSTKGKSLRYPPFVKKYAMSIYPRLNISRSFGDLGVNKIKDNERILPISSKFKMTVQKVLEGDVIISGSDGLWDVLTNVEIIRQLKAGERNINGNNLCSLALNKGSNDNISVIAVKVT